jgi:hypothetical protein
MSIVSGKGSTVLKGAVGFMTASATSFARPLLVAAPLVATALFFASGTNAQTSEGTPPPSGTTASTTITPRPAPAAARKEGPKLRDKHLRQGRSVAPATTDPATPTQTTAPVAPIDAPEAARTGRPKEKEKEATNDSVENLTPATEPVAQPTERRREGPKGDGSHGRTETPAPDTQPAGRRREGPKGDVDHGRTSTTPLIIGALGAATVLALVVSSGNDRPASP